MKILILAGGFAKRLWPLTVDKAKPLLPLGNKEMISHILEKIPHDAEIIVSTNTAFQDDFYFWRDKHLDRNIKIYIEDSKSEVEKKGALAAVKLVIDEFSIDEDLFVIGGDNYFEFNFQDFLNQTKDTPMLAAFDIQDLEQAKKYGVVIADDCKIIDFQEKPEQPKSTLVATCVYYFPKHSLSHLCDAAEITPDKIGSVFEYFLKKGIESHVFSSKEYWNDIGSLEAYLESHAKTGIGTHIPDYLLHPDAQNVFEGVNYIDPNCRIENSFIKDSIILSGVSIRNSKIVSSVIDKQCELQDVELANEIVEQKTIKTG